MRKASEIIEYANIDQLEQHIEHVEILIKNAKKSNTTDDNLINEHNILTKRFNELLDE